MLTISPELLPYFKCFCSSPSVIMLFVYMKCRFSLSYRDLEEMMMIRGAKIDHATLHGGKSTLVKLLLRFYDPQKGKILIDNQNIKDIDLESLRRVIGFVPQDITLFNQTIFHNIQYAEPLTSKEEVIEAAHLAQLHETITLWPQGYETLVGEKGLKLSGGEKQRLAIARALLRKPKILIFDEATSALDTKTENQLASDIDQLSKNYTCIIIAHRLSTTKNADRIILIHNGEIKENGTHNSLLKRSKYYAELWGHQVQHLTDPKVEPRSL